ncbi:MAG: hypothetical protein A3F67_08355 [Verrucomicrobia bacterium RIFCSPHIGHO2_12_FULL_41_10]|nr:MAG: hypothetical protein A3F67_08355 [Verrucomicrobia bacterium RIFCSPHIGHO2_12_FULL_41_10]
MTITEKASDFYHYWTDPSPGITTYTENPQTANNKGRVNACVYQIIHAKETNIKELTSLKSRAWSFDEWVLIGGDLFTMGYLALEGMIALSPGLLSPSVQAALSAFGIVGGVINIFVGVISLKNALQEWREGHYMGATRLFLDSALCIGIGSLMIIASLAAYTSIFGGVAGALVYCPWIFPLLFFVMNFPVICEVANRLYHITRGTTPSSQLFSSQEAVLPYFSDQNYTDEEIIKELSKILETWQDLMGVQTALALFKYKTVQQFHPGCNTEKLREEFEKRKKEWERAQWVRALQMALYTAAFATSLIALSPQLQKDQALFSGIQNLAMAGANLLPLLMDIFWPFKRNTYLPVPGIALEKAN